MSIIHSISEWLQKVPVRRPAGIEFLRCLCLAQIFLDQDPDYDQATED